eukprot:SAG11_NODE_340_length_10476_cov_6.009155_1_plen_54_part_00
MDVNTNFPAGCPFFYGYVIAAVCTGIKIAKAGGQNNLLGVRTLFRPHASVNRH